MGPWVHGGWARGAGDHLGDVDFGGPTGPHYRDDIEFKFFSHYLKGAEMNIAPVNTFETGVINGRNIKHGRQKKRKKNNCIYCLAESYHSVRRQMVR